MDFSANRGAVVVGFDFSGDDMLRGQLLTMQQGLTVLYGLNGAGKSRLLRGIRGALLGIQTDVRVGLVTRAVSTKFDTESIGEGEAKPRPLALALAQELATPQDFSASPGQRSSERRMQPEAVDRVIAAHIEETLGRTYPLLLEEALQDRLFLLTPTGAEGTTSWAAYPVLDPRRPAARQAHEDHAAIEAEYNDDDGDGAYDRYMERMREIPLLEEGGNFWVAGAHPGRVSPSSVSLYSARGVTLDFVAPITLLGDVDLGLDLLDLGRDAVAATQHYISELVAGAIERHSDDDSGGPHEETFPLGNVSRISALLRRVDEEEMLRLGPPIERTVEEACCQLGERVSRALSDVLLDPLVARLQVAPAALRHAGVSHAWKFNRSDSDSVDVSLDALSKAERQWATRSINEAIHWHRRENGARPDDPLRPVVYLLDEPEAALHRAAEAYMARSLLVRAADPRCALIVATHSPELLDTTEARLVELRRSATPATSTVLQLDLSDRAVLKELGLTTSDLLRWPRVLLLVEGLHDQVLLDHYLGARLRAARVDVLTLHGGRKLPLTVDSRVLFEHTEAHVVGLVDNEDARTIRNTWERAQSAAVQGDKQSAIDIVLQGIPRVRSESDFIRNWLTGALEHGLDGRITPYALELPDIIEYLPVKAFLPGAASWDALKREHQKARAASVKTAKEFKPWLGVTYGVEFTNEALRQAASGTPLPKEFDLLMKTLEAIAAERG